MTTQINKAANLWALCAAFALSVCATGCVPIPKKSVIHYGVQGRLTDAVSGKPIGKSHLVIIVDGRAFDRKTNSRGQFRVPPEMHPFWTWLGGPMWLDATRTTAEISLHGRTRFQKTFIVREERPYTIAPPDVDQLQGGYVMLGDVAVGSEVCIAVGMSYETAVANIKHCGAVTCCQNPRPRKN